MNGKYWERFFETGHVSDYLEYKMSGKTECGTEEKQTGTDCCLKLYNNDMQRNHEKEQTEFIR